MRSLSALEHNTAFPLQSYGAAAHARPARRAAVEDMLRLYDGRALPRVTVRLPQPLRLRYDVQDACSKPKPSSGDVPLHTEEESEGNAAAMRERTYHTQTARCHPARSTRLPRTR